MKALKVSLLVTQMLFLLVLRVKSQDGWSSFPANANQELPPGVPRIVETNGAVLFIDSRFTTPAFEEEGLKLVIGEANKVANDLSLPENLPITRSNLTHIYISTFGYTYKTKKLGNITTSNYWYGVEQNYKLSDGQLRIVINTCSITAPNLIIYQIVRLTPMQLTSLQRNGFWRHI